MTPVRQPPHRERRFRTIPIGLHFMLMLTLGSCVYLEPLPASQIELAGTSWKPVAIDGDPLPEPGSYEVHFVNLDNAVIQTPCRKIEAGLLVDSDGSGLGFVDPRASPLLCEPELEQAEGAVVDALLATQSWEVRDSNTIVLVGERRLEMQRAVAGSLNVLLPPDNEPY